MNKAIEKRKRNFEVWDTKKKAKLSLKCSFNTQGLVNDNIIKPIEIVRKFNKSIYEGEEKINRYEIKIDDIRETLYNDVKFKVSNEHHFSVLIDDNFIIIEKEKRGDKDLCLNNIYSKSDNNKINNVDTTIKHTYKLQTKYLWKTLCTENTFNWSDVDYCNKYNGIAILIDEDYLIIEDIINISKSETNYSSGEDLPRQDGVDEYSEDDNFI